MSDAPFVSKLKKALGKQFIATEEHCDRAVAVISADGLLKAATLLRDDKDLKLDLLMDLGSADYQGYTGEQKPERLVVSYQFFSTTKRHRAWLKVYLAADTDEIESLIKIYPAANWYEREAWDMYGIKFTGHPHLKRILLYEEFQGHPLRKDYAIGKMQPLVPMRDAVDYESVESAKRREGK